MRSEREIENEVNAAADVIAQGESRVPGMSYEEGVDAALRWALGWQDERPMSDE